MNDFSNDQCHQWQRNCYSKYDSDGGCANQLGTNFYNFIMEIYSCGAQFKISVLQFLGLSYWYQVSNQNARMQSMLLHTCSFGPIQSWDLKSTKNVWIPVETFLQLKQVVFFKNLSWECFSIIWYILINLVNFLSINSVNILINLVKLFNNLVNIIMT